MLVLRASTRIFTIVPRRDNRRKKKSCTQRQNHISSRRQHENNLVIKGPHQCMELNFEMHCNGNDRGWPTKRGAREREREKKRDEIYIKSDIQKVLKRKIFVEVISCGTVFTICLYFITISSLSFYALTRSSGECVLLLLLL